MSCRKSNVVSVAHLNKKKYDQLVVIPSAVYSGNVVIIPSVLYNDQLVVILYAVCKINYGYTTCSVYDQPVVIPSAVYNDPLVVIRCK